MAPTQIVDDTQARINRIEQRMRSLHVSDGIMGWDGYDDMPVAALPVEFRMSDIERYTRIGCPRIHLQLYNTVMRGHRLDEAQMIMLVIPSVIEWCYSALVCLIGPFET